MQSFIQWCNNNSGFVSAILSIVGIAISLIAIIVSIKTARLPYKKKLMLSSSALIGANTAAGLLATPAIIGMEAAAANVGNRAISITYLGYAIKKDGQFSKIYPVNRQFDCKGLLNPSEVKSVQFSTEELVKGFAKEDPKTELYVFASDTEGKEYLRKAGTVGKLLSNLTKQL